jgi:hypothetical protein
VVLELREQTSAAPALEQIRAAFDKLEKGLEAKRPRAVRP